MNPWIRLTKEDAESDFWPYVEYPIFGKCYGKEYSAWSISVKHRGSGFVWEVFVEKQEWKILYNPFEDKFRLSLKIRTPNYISICKYNTLRLKPFLKRKIESIKVNGSDVTREIIYYVDREESNKSGEEI